jgi:hypothetical protein
LSHIQADLMIGSTPATTRRRTKWWMACLSITCGMPGNCSSSDTPGMLDERLGDLSHVNWNHQFASYSVRSAFRGSTCVARNAGTYMAASETATSKAAAMPDADVSKLRKGNGDLLTK